MLSFLTLHVEKTQHQLSFWHGAIETFRLCQRDLFLAPARIITQCIESAWDLKSIKSPVTSQLTSDQLPSKERPKGIGILSDDTEKTYSLHWQKELLKYENDLYVYVWQPHLERTPSARYNSATVVIPPPSSNSQTGASSAHRLLVFADPPDLMSRFLETETAFVKSTQTQHTWDATDEKLRVLAVLLKWMVEDSSNLVDDMSSKAKDMVSFPDLLLRTHTDFGYRLIEADACLPGVRFNISSIWTIAAASLSQT